MSDSSRPLSDSSRHLSDSCGTCIYFNTRAYLCRRFPESVIKRSDDWCGEHKGAVFKSEGTLSGVSNNSNTNVTTLDTPPKKTRRRRNTRSSG